MKQILIILIIGLLMFSCKNYRLSKSDLEWQPYKVGDKLIFQSNKGELDTIYIKSIELHRAEDDPLTIFPNIFETQYVNGKRKILLSIGASSNGNSYISFNLTLGKTYMRNPTMYFELKEIEPSNHKQSFDRFSKYFKIKAIEQASNMKEHPFDLRYIYWSKEYGYLGLEFKDDYIWTLKSFVRNGKELL